MAILTLCKAGDHVVSASTLYGGTHTLLGVNLKKLGIEATLRRSRRPGELPPGDAAEDEAPLRRDARQSARSTSSTSRRVGAIAHEAGVPFVVDNTVPSPYLCRPFEWGADIVVHSATKYIGGHGTTMGGVIVESGKFPWGNGKFPDMHDALAGLPRRDLPRDLRRLRLHHEGAHGDHAHLRPDALADQRLAAAAGARDAAAADGAPLRQCARGGEVPVSAPQAGGVGELPRPAGQQVLRARAQVPAQGRIGLLNFGVKGGARPARSSSSQRSS